MKGKTNRELPTQKPRWSRLLSTSQRTTTYGRACVRLIEAADALLGYRPAWTEALLLRLVRALYRHRQRSLVAALLPEVSAEILAASEKIEGPGAGVWTELRREPASSYLIRTES